MFKFGLFRQKPVSIKPDEVRLFLRGKFDSEIRSTTEKLYSNALDIRNNFSHVREIAAALRSKHSHDKYSNTVKGRFCAKSLGAVEALPGFERDYESLKNFVAAAAEAMQLAGSMNMKEFRHLHLFREEMTKIAEKIRAIESKVSESSGIISNSVVNRIGVVDAEIKKMKEEEESLSAALEELELMKNRSASIARSLDEKNVAIEKLAGELSRHAEEKPRLRGLKKQEEEIRMKLSEEFSGLTRTLKKFEYYGDLGKEQAAVLGYYIKNPAEAFLEDSRNIFREILSSMLGYKERKLIDLDEKKLEKLRDLLRRFDLLAEIREHHQHLRSQVERLEAEIRGRTDPVSSAIRERTAERDAMRKELEKLNRDIKLKGSEIRGMETAKSGLRKAVESKLSELLGSDVILISE